MDLPAISTTISISRGVIINGGMIIMMWASGLKNISDRFKPLAERKNLCIILNLDMDTIMIQSDKELFSRIMHNLITNALKHAKTAVAVSVKRQ